MHACMRAKSPWPRPTLCDPVDCSPPGFSAHGILQAKYWSRLPCPPPEALPHPRMEPWSLVSPALAGEFYTTSATQKPWDRTQTTVTWKACPWKQRIQRFGEFTDIRGKVGGGETNMYLLTFYFIKKGLFFLNWSIVDLQYYVSFRYIAKSFHYIFFQIIFHNRILQDIVLFPVLYSKSWFYIYFIYSSVHLSIPSS